jgi:hypothetical protein
MFSDDYVRDIGWTMQRTNVETGETCPDMSSSVSFRMLQLYDWKVIQHFHNKGKVIPMLN